MSRKIGWVLLIVGAVGLIGMGGLTYHHNHVAQTPQEHGQQISPEVRAAVLAVVGDNTHVTNEDVAEFLRAAKLASRTKHDAEIIGMFDRYVSLVKQSAYDRHWEAENRHLAAKSQSLARAFAQENQEWKASADSDRGTHVADTAEFAKESRNDAASQLADAKRLGDEAQRDDNEAGDLLNKLREELR